MPFNLALADLVSPYLTKGENLGPWHAALSVIRVVQFETASDVFGTVIRGRCQFNGKASINPSSGALVVQAAVDEGEPPFDPNRRTPIFDIRETTLDFELFVPRDGSQIIGAGVTSISAAAFQPTRDVLDVWDTLPIDPAPSDFPASGFQLDLVLNAPSVRPPFLHPAKLAPDGTLVPDDDFKEVALRLPKLRFRLAHGNALGSRLSFELVSVGVAGLDDPGDIGVAELISMEPPYAFVGKKDERTVGFGFRSAVLDISEGSTPPAVIEKFGFGDDWFGLYLREVRFFIAPEGTKDLAFQAGVKDLLIGFGEHAGVSGDFEVAVVNQGDGELKVSARFFDANDKAFGIRPGADDEHATALLPAVTRMVVDIEGGRAPYECEVSVNGAAAQSGRIFKIDLTLQSPQTISIEVSDASTTPIEKSLEIEATHGTSQTYLVIPGETTPTPGQVEVTPVSGEIIKDTETADSVTVRTRSDDPSYRWSVDGGPETPAGQRSFMVEVAVNETKTVTARRPGTTVPTSLDCYFYFDEPKAPEGNEASALRTFAQTSDNISTVRAVDESHTREAGHQDPFVAYREFLELVPDGATITVRGEASYENVDSKRDYNYHLARRRAIAIAERLKAEFATKHFVVNIDPAPANPSNYGPLAAWTTNWKTHGDPGRRDFWKATIVLPPGTGQPEKTLTATVHRPVTTTTEPDILKPIPDTPPAPPRAPDWFRSVKLKVRIVRDSLVAAELESEIDIQTAAEESIQNSGAPSATAPEIHTLENGAPIGADNPGDGITQLHVLIQRDNSIDQLTTLIAIGANPADKDGLAAAGWMPGETMPPDKDFGLTLLGSYLTFWPLLVSAADGNDGSTEDAVLLGAAILTPAVIAALPFFRTERVILFGGEFLLRDRGGEREAFLLFDVEVDWSVDISIGSTDIIQIEREHPLAVRYKAIGLRFGNRGEDGSPQFSIRPVFDSSRGYTIDIAKDGSLKVASPFDQILKVLAARISRTNPFMFEIDIGMAVDLGVVTVDRARVRLQLDPPGLPELTALGLSVDISGALVGSGYAEIDETSIAGQLDLTLRTISLRVSAAVGISNVDDGGQTATAVYVGLSVVLPVGIPLGQSGLGIFGFRGIFGMHYARNEAIGAGTSAPALQWLAASEGQPHLLKLLNGTDLWIPELDRWSFGLGVLIGTMEGGFIMNLDGTLILELPGPRVLVVMNARILSPPPELEGMGVSGGILAVIEITPDHILIGILAQYDIGGLISIKVPVDALFSFDDITAWHVYLGQRTAPIEVKVLEIVKGTGYLMVQGNGLAAYKTLPAVQGIAIGIGAAASFTWGNTDIGLYLRIGGGMDAVIGFDPFILGGVFEISGELRLFIVSVGAHANLTVIVKETAGGNLDTYIHGEACGSVSFFFFDIEGCVEITISAPEPGPAPMPALVEKLSLKSRSPALAQGTGVDRGIDASLGDGVAAASDPKIITVPIDSVPILSMVMPPVSANTTFQGAAANVQGTSGVAPGEFATRGTEKYRYDLTSVTLERIDPAGPALIGSVTPATWWIAEPPTGTNIVAQLALLTWEATPAPKAIEKTEHLEESITDRWGQVCDDAAPPVSVLWTFRYEKLGPSLFGWQLEGIAWPDPPGTVRSSEPDTRLDVSERWRTGNAILDGKRGIFPAMVIGGHVRCELQQRPDVVRDERPKLVVGGRGPILERPVFAAESLVAESDPVLELVTHGAAKEPFRISSRLYEKAAAFQPMDATVRDMDAVVAGVLRGEAITFVEMQRAVTAPPRAQAAATGDGKRCEVRLLQAPMLDDGRLIVIGSQADEALVKQALDEHGVTHGPLDDVVVLHMGPFKEARLLLFVEPAIQRLRRLVVRVLDADGNQISATVPSNADRVPPKGLPASWNDTSGPWADDIDDLLAWPPFSGSFTSYATLLVGVPGSEKADRIEIGVMPASGERAKEMRPGYFVGAIEALRMGEVTRSEWDEFKIEKDHEVLTNILGPASTDNAFMFPGSLYKVTATWTGTRDSGGSAGDTQEFFFRTDTEPPKHLDPWMLMTLPSDGEASYFGAEPVRLVFNTHDIDRLFGAYSKELRVSFQAASAHHPEPEPTVPHPFPIDAVTLQPIKGHMFSPWEEVLVEVIGSEGLCIDIDEDRSRHSILDIPLPLDPYTDYIMDVSSVDIGAAQSAKGDRVYRRHFSTGAYGTFAGFASSLQAVLVSHRFAPTGAMTSIRSFFGARRPEGSELDEQLRTVAKVEALGAPRMPGITVFWEQSGSNPPQPAAVLIDASEPMWRSRPYATKFVDSSGPTTAERWKMEEKLWLELAQAASSDPVIAANGFIRAPGDQRALIVLAPNSRGKTLNLDLVRLGFTESYLNTPETRFSVAELTFDKAPWEE